MTTPMVDVRCSVGWCRLVAASRFGAAGFLLALSALIAGCWDQPDGMARASPSYSVPGAASVFARCAADEIACAGTCAAIERDPHN